MNEFSQFKNKPKWLKVPLAKGEKYIQLKSLVKKNNLATICQSGNCPNMGECWNSGTATFLILGTKCTRNCLFCDVEPGRPQPPSPSEPFDVADAVKKMNLMHCVITSVTRDDLPDYGASHWAATIAEVKKHNPGVTMEVLIPDMHDKIEFLKIIADQKPDIISHNIETVKRLFPLVRPQANYQRSLKQLKDTAQFNLITKSGFMVGLGETEAEVFELLVNLHEQNTQIVTIGQYLAPSPNHYPLNEYIHPDQFIKYKEYGEKIGIRKVISAPLVRSSYHSERQL